LISQHRHEIQMLAGETGLEIGEFRKIVQMVQKGEREARQAKKERRLNGHNQLPKIILGIKFTDGIEIVRSQAQTTAA
jgi:hypothetical protein